MRIVALQERQDHDTTLRGAAALCAALLLALALVPAQSATAQGAVPCTAIEDSDERLACYDRALRAAPAPAATPPPAARPPARNEAPAAAPSAASAPTAGATEPRRERRVRESAAPVAPGAPAAPVAGSSEDVAVIPIVIVSARALPGREMTFTAADGTTWVQTDSQRIVGLPDTPFDAEIKPGVMGSHFLVAKDRARAIRVRPVR